MTSHGVHAARESLVLQRMARVAGSICALIGLWWVALWIAGLAPLWGATMITIKANLAVAQVLGGVALIIVAKLETSTLSRATAIIFALFVALIGLLTLSQHLIGWDLGIDQLLANEPPAAMGTASPNRIGPLGSLSVALAGIGLLGLALRRQRLAHYAGLAVCVLVLVPAVGYLYGVEDLFSRARVTGIAWYSVVALMSLGLGLMFAPPHRKDGPVSVLLLRDPGGVLLRWLLPAAVIGPLAFGFAITLGEKQGFLTNTTGTATLVVAVVLSFAFLLWVGAQSLSRSSEARDKAEQKLRESEAKYRALFENMSEGFALGEPVFGPHGKPCDFRFLQINKAFEQQTGLGGDIVGKPVKQALPNLEQHWIDSYCRVALGGPPVHFDAPNADTGRHYDVFCYSPAPGSFAIIFTDVTDRFQSEKALRESELFYRQTLESIPGMVFTTRPDGFCDYQSQQWVDYTGVAMHEHLGEGWNKLLHPEDRPRAFEAWQAAVEGRAPYDLEYRVRRHDGQYEWFKVIARPIKGETGKIVRWFGVAANIDELKNAESALRESEELFRVMFTQSSAGKVQAELDSGRLLRVNPAFCRMTGYTEEELLKMSFGDLVHTEDRTRYFDRFKILGLDDEGAHDSEQRFSRKDGSVIWTHITVNVIRDAQGRPLRATALVQDITQRKQAEAVLARSREELERLVTERTAKLRELVAELEHLSYTITHDMRAPLRAMQGFAELMAETVNKSGDSNSKVFLQRIRTSAARMDLLITDALSYSKAVRQELTLAPVDLGALLRGMLDSYPEFQPRKAQIQILDSIPKVIGNQAALTQCFSNLLGNAVKFVNPGQVPEIRITAENCNGWVRIWVEDNGIGIPETMKPRVFEMFSRGHNNYEGTGIGLALVRKVVDRMGGRVGVESELGKGSRFWVELKPGDLRPSFIPIG